MSKLDVIAGLMFCIGILIASFPVRTTKAGPTKRALMIGEASVWMLAFYIGCRVGEFWE